MMTEILIGAMCFALLLVAAAVIFWVLCMVILGAKDVPTPWDEENTEQIEREP